MLSHFSREIPFMKHRRILLGISATLVVLSVVGLIARGLVFGIEFQGGTEVDFTDTGSITIEQMRDALVKTGESDPTIQTSVNDGTNGFMVRTTTTDPKTANQHAAAAATSLGLTEDHYTVTTMAFGVAIVLIIAYVSIRYEFKMSITAIAALLHDLVVTLGVYAWTQTAITPNVVAALLTIMGYSLYDTVVEFNRTDENAKTLKDGIHRTYFQICNYSINEVIVRTINTTITTIVPVICMLLLGGATLKDFAFAMLVGELLGTYSSFAVASPLLAIWKTREKKWARLEQKYGEAAQAASVEEVAPDAAEKGAE